MPIPSLNPIKVPSFVCTECSENLAVERIIGPKGKLVGLVARCTKCAYEHFPSMEHSNGETKMPKAKK